MYEYMIIFRRMTLLQLVTQPCMYSYMLFTTSLVMCSFYKCKFYKCKLGLLFLFANGKKKTAACNIAAAGGTMVFFFFFSSLVYIYSSFPTKLPASRLCSRFAYDCLARRGVGWRKIYFIYSDSTASAVAASSAIACFDSEDNLAVRAKQTVFP